MAFFSKLKDRLFKSSSKIDEGLEVIVEDGGVVEAAQPQDSATVGLGTPADPSESSQAMPVDQMLDAPGAAARELPVADGREPPPVPHEDNRSAAQRDAGGITDVQPPTPSPQPDTPGQPTPVPNPDIPPDPGPEIPPDPGPAPEVPPDDTPEIQPDPIPELPPEQEPEIVPDPEPEITPDPVPDPEPGRPSGMISPVTARAPDALAEPTRVSARSGLMGRLLGRRDSAPVLRRTLDDAMLEQLEELLIASDMGVETAVRVVANVAEGHFGRKLSVQEIKTLLATELARIMEPVARPLPIYPKRPQVVLVVGVNGSGKTTTIGKLASQFRAAGKNVVIAAGDTFRAAAVEQLQVWGERAGVPVLTAPEGSDPASLAFDAMSRAQADGADLLMIDTAGRLQNRTDLMEELAKIVRVIRKKDDTAPHNTLLVLDATTGQNALNQVKVFSEISDVSGLVMTKLDGTAKGGVLVALADRFGLPIHAIGVGEQIDDLDAFDPEDFADALMGLERA